MSVPASAAKPPPGRWWYVVAGLIAAAAVAVTIYFVIHRVSGLTDRLVQVVVPGQASLTLNETGSYTIFHEYRSVVDGKVYSTGSVSDLRVTVAGPDGRRVSLTSPSGTSRYSIAGGPAARSSLSTRPSRASTGWRRHTKTAGASRAPCSPSAPGSSPAFS